MSPSSVAISARLCRNGACIPTVGRKPVSGRRYNRLIAAAGRFDRFVTPTRTAENRDRSAVACRFVGRAEGFCAEARPEPRFVRAGRQAGVKPEVAARHEGGAREPKVAARHEDGAWEPEGSVWPETAAESADAADPQVATTAESALGAHCDGRRIAAGANSS
jgi:hypothetical protein